MSEPPPLRADAALFLDFDGTLIDIAGHPSDIVMPIGLKMLLTGIRDHLGGALALVSGRSLAQIDLLFGGYPFDVAGSHGFEFRLAGGEPSVHPLDPSLIDEVTHDILAAAHQFRGLFIERKAHSVALHYRADPRLAPVAEALARQELAKLGPDYRLQEGKAVIELVPRGAHKGAAIERFMLSAPYFGKTAVFVGDDTTDENGFAFVNAIGGISIRVAETDDVTLARYRLSRPEILREWLEAAL